MTQLLAVGDTGSMAVITLLHMIISICNATSVLRLMIPLLRTVTSDNTASVTVVV